MLLLLFAVAVDVVIAAVVAVVAVDVTVVSVAVGKGSQNHCAGEARCYQYSALASLWRNIADDAMMPLMLKPALRCEHRNNNKA